MKVFPDRKEAEEILLYDKAVDLTASKLEYDLTEEQEKVSKKYTCTGTRQVTKTQQKKERKPNATKGGLITELFSFLTGENVSFAIKNAEITNKERQITFQIGDDKFEITLTQKRKK